MALTALTFPVPTPFRRATHLPATVSSARAVVWHPTRRTVMTVCARLGGHPVSGVQILKDELGEIAELGSRTPDAFALLADRRTLGNRQPEAMFRPVPSTAVCRLLARTAHRTRNLPAGRIRCREIGQRNRRAAMDNSSPRRRLGGRVVRRIRGLRVSRQVDGTRTSRNRSCDTARDGGKGVISVVQAPNFPQRNGIMKTAYAVSINADFR